MGAALTYRLRPSRLFNGNHSWETLAPCPLLWVADKGPLFFSRFMVSVDAEAACPGGNGEAGEGGRIGGFKGLAIKAGRFYDLP